MRSAIGKCGSIWMRTSPLLTRLSDARYRALVRNDAAAIHALHDAAAVWIGNDTADQIDRRAYRLLLGNGRTHVKQALGRLGGEGGTVLQASRRIAQSWRFRRIRRARVVRLSPNENCGKDDERARHHRRECCRNFAVRPSSRIAKQQAKADSRRARGLPYARSEESQPCSWF